MTKALFWDSDGTLTYCKSAWSMAMCDALQSFGHDVDFETIRTHTSSGFSWHTPHIAYPDATGLHWWNRLFAHYHELYRNHEIDPSEFAAIDGRFRDQMLVAKRYILSIIFPSCRKSWTNLAWAGFSKK